MSFAAIAQFGGASPVDALSSPYRVSICVAESATSTDVLLINGLGAQAPAVTSALDLKTFFGSHFRSLPLLRAFRALRANDTNLAEQQLVSNLLVTMTAINGAPAATMPGVDGYPVQSIGGINIPFLEIVSPGVTGAWRLDIQFRHSSWS